MNMPDMSDCFPESALLYSFCSLRQTWTSREVVVKIENKPFGRGLTRQAYRLKLVFSDQYGSISQIDWDKASKYVGKSANTDDGEIEVDCDRAECFHVAQLQHEAFFWADKFNDFIQAEDVKIIKCSVLELCERPSRPVISCEQMIEGVNLESFKFSVFNSTTVTTEFPPLAYFLYSFYASCGTSVVVHIEGGEGIFTNPQIHSVDCRFGSVDSGRRGMAMFFANLNWNIYFDKLKLPEFQLSIKEKERIAKRVAQANRPKRIRKSTSRGLNVGMDNADECCACQSTPSPPPQIKRSDSLFLEKKLVSNSSFSVNARFSGDCDSSSIGAGAVKSEHNTSGSIISLMPDEVEEVRNALVKAISYARRVVSTLTPASQASRVDDGLELFHRNISLTEDILLPSAREYIIAGDEKRGDEDICSENILFLQRNVAEVHMELAVLEAVGQFSHSSAVRFGTAAFSAGTGGDSDVSSCIFHLCEASVMGSCAASLSLARLSYGLPSAVLASLMNYVPINLCAALDLFLLAAHRGSIAALGFAAEICAKLQDFESAILLYRLALHAAGYDTVQGRYKSCDDKEGLTFTVGEIVEANYLGCGSWYSAEVISAQYQGSSWMYSVRYVDGGEEESNISSESVRNVGGQCAIHETETALTEANEASVGEGSHSERRAAGGYEDAEHEKGCHNKHDGLVTPMCRLGLGSDNEPHLSIHQILACIGEIYRLLFEANVVSRQSAASTACSALMTTSLLGNELGLLSSSVGSQGATSQKDHYHALALSYYNQALVCALADEKKTSSQEYTSICFELENVS